MIFILEVSHNINVSWQAINKNDTFQKFKSNRI